MECHPHDLKWINEQIKKAPPVKQFYLRESYSKTYNGANRRECNTRLREYIEKINKSACHTLR